MIDSAPAPEISAVGFANGSDDATSAPGTAQPPPEPTPARPLGDIALSLSGGGYRAAGFHLGVLGFLHGVGLLPSVAALSTVSGGSIVGAAWVVSVLDGKAFGEFSEGFRAFLLRTNVIREALRHVAGHRRHGELEWPSLIRSAARIYAAPDFLGDRKFGELFDARLPLREMIFNSTEFRTGVDFRFRRSDNAQARIGNGNVWMRRDVADHVRLADIVAASSCFPGAFEPIRFPDDFAWPADFPLDEARQKLGPMFDGGLPLMDGGIYDNQGVDSLVLAYNRGAAATLLISDTSPRQESLFTYPPARKPGWVTIRMVSILGWLLFALAAGSLSVLAGNARQHWKGGLHDWLLYVVPALLALGTVAGLAWLRHRVVMGAAAARSQIHIEHLWKDIRNLTVAEAAGMAELRAASMLALTSSVFMKRIRGLIYDNVFQDKRFDHRRMACLIYGLEESRPKLFAKYPWLRPNPKLVAEAQKAEGMATTLWFDDPSQLARLERVGAATICFVLIKFILEDRAEYAAIPGSPVALLLERLKAEWGKINGVNA
ncbi:MAG TPA: patatin-like phospholipase family protein [Longimicrobiaceae bacterium]|jgi:predicted acylesterase/phospholipase RssA|nr:patatin-like phospholipase family protein [Longimicrobiaceae bacterium]